MNEFLLSCNLRPFFDVEHVLRCARRLCRDAIAAIAVKATQTSAFGTTLPKSVGQRMSDLTE